MNTLHNIYEIYTKHSETGERGWGIYWVRAKDKAEVSNFPNFDCILTVNDYAGRGDIYDINGKII